MKASIRPGRHPCKSIDDLEIAVVEHIDWFNYRRLHGDYAAEAGGNPDSRANQAFRQAYEARLHELDAQTAV